MPRSQHLLLDAEERVESGYGRKFVISGQLTGQTVSFNVLATVVLTRDMAEHGLCKGDLGTVVEVYEGDGLEVEFVAANGETQAVLTLTQRDVRGAGATDILATRASRPSA